ncbi:MAG TPA: TolC family protein [Herbaspirillum sp.]|nr:TolC family protein [Herbaspirillum sp.]
MAFDQLNPAARIVALPLLLSLLLPIGSQAVPVHAPLLAASATPANAREMTLSEAIELAVARHPALQQRKAQLQGAEARIGAAEAPYYPQVGVDFGSALIKPSHQSDPGGLTLRASQLLYDFGKTDNDVQAAKMIGESAGQLVTETRLTIAESVAVLYNDRLRFVQLIAVLEKNYDMLQQIREVSALRADAGLNSRSDIQLADVRMSDVHATRASYQAQLRSVEARLATLLGVRPAGFAPLPAGLVERALQRNEVNWDGMPQIRAAGANVQAAQARVKSVKAGLLPSVHLQANSRGLNPLSGGRGGPDNSVMLVLRSDNIFEGGAGQARVSAALAEVAASEAEVENLKFSIEQNFNDLRSDLDGALERAGIYGQQSQQAVLERDTYREEYTLGKRTLNNLLDAQRNIMNAETQQVSNQFDAVRSAIKLAKLTQAEPDYATPFMHATDAAPQKILSKQPKPHRSGFETIVETYMQPGDDPATFNQRFLKEEI